MSTRNAVLAITLAVLSSSAAFAQQATNNDDAFAAMLNAMAPEMVLVEIVPSEEPKNLELLQVVDGDCSIPSNTDDTTVASDAYMNSLNCIEQDIMSVETTALGS